MEGVACGVAKLAALGEVLGVSRASGDVSGSRVWGFRISSLCYRAVGLR